MNESIIAVDINDKVIDRVSKEQAHADGVLHRAFSVMLINSQGDILLQKRAHLKYHCGGLWSNACCSHPLWGEDLEIAVKRRLKQELGIFNVEVKKIGQQLYYYKFGNNIKEYEFDHVFWGVYNGDIAINHNEIDEIRWIDFSKLVTEIWQSPYSFTPWFIQMVPMIQRELEHMGIKMYYED